jgi:hypothetical protein
MALIKCKECNKEISKKADKCPHCGAPVGPKQYSIFSLVFVIIIIWVLWKIFSPTPSINSALKPTASTASPPLKLLASTCNHDNGFIQLEGEVQNISSKKLDNVEAVGLFRAKDGTLVKSVDMLVEYNPIMPNQTSPFHVITTTNPMIKTCNISFKSLTTGEEIAYIDTLKKK